MMDDDRCGHPVSKSKTSDVTLVKKRLDVDRRVTMHELCSELDMGYRPVHRILKDDSCILIKIWSSIWSVDRETSQVHSVARCVL